MSAHKEMEGFAYGNLVKRYTRRFGLTADFDPQTQGGIISTFDAVPVRQVRPPKYRATENNPMQTKKDIAKIFTAQNPSISPGNTGAELELFVHNKNGDMEPVAEDGHPVRRKLQEHNENYKNGTTNGNGNGNGVKYIESDGYDPKIADERDKYIGYSPELTRHMIELNFPPGREHKRRNHIMLYGLRKLASFTEAEGSYVAPISIVPNKEIESTDINSHEYVQRMAFKILGKDRMKHFNGASFQTHTEIIDFESALKATNKYQLVTPILYAGTVAGPYIAGEVESDLRKRYEAVPGVAESMDKQEKLDDLPGGKYDSYRYPSREFGSVSGGVMLDPLPEKERDYWDKANELLKKQEVPSVGRVSGHHTDFRIRPDLGPYGTIELAALDTCGGKVEKLVAMQEFTRALGWKLQYLELTGKMKEIQSHPEYKKLFGVQPTTDSYKTVRKNAIKASKNGNKAMLEGMDGNEYSVRDLWKILTTFVQDPVIDPKNSIDYRGIPGGILRQLNDSYENPAEQFDKYKDENGVTAIDGFYKTGVGTLSQWARKREDELRACGVSDPEIIKDFTISTGRAFHAHVKNTTPEMLDSLYIS